MTPTMERVGYAAIPAALAFSSGYIAYAEESVSALLVCLVCLHLFALELGGGVTRGE